MDYLEFFKLDDDPFRLTPDPGYFFPSQEHNEILNSLNYAIEQKEGFSLVVGQPGTGKTTILRILIDHWKDSAEIALIMTPRLMPEEFLQAILEDLNIELSGRNKNEMLKAFRDILITHAATGKRIIIIVDEAQNMPDETIEELRLLSNLETEKEKLLQIILMGQPELQKKLTAAHLRQLDQRITIRATLRPLTRSETSDYINFRLIKAGKGTIIFDEESRKRIYDTSKGIPRVINLVASRALMAAFVSGSVSVSKDHVKYAMEHLAGEQNAAWRQYIPFLTYGGIATVIVLVIVAGFYAFSGRLSSKNKYPANSIDYKVEAKGTVPVSQELTGKANSPARVVRHSGNMPPEGALPKPANTSRYVIISAQSANVRSAPNVASEKVAWATKGTMFPVLGKKTDNSGRTWYKVQYPTEKECWISEKLVEER
ncbi:MAG: AAA family ATPase [Syntrophorhabdus sp.]